MPLDFDALAAPFPPDEIEWRVGSTTSDKKKGMALAYIDARAVMDRLDAVCGPGGWQCRYPHANGKTCCEVGILTDNGWVWKSDGAGDTDYEAAKGAFSDAFKRAAVRWGVGRYLYGIDSPWVAIKQRGKSYIIEGHELANLRKLIEGKGFKQSPPSNSRDPNWKGPLAKVALKDELGRMFATVGECDDMETLQSVLDEYAAVIEQARHDVPGWMNGEGMPSEFIPGDDRIERQRNYIKEREKGAAA